MSTKLVNELHLVIHQNLEDLLPRILETWQEAKQGRRETKVSFVGLDDIEELTSYTWEANLEELITGCLESAFWMMDKAALASRREWKVAASKDPRIYSFHRRLRCLVAALPLWRSLSAIGSLLQTLATPGRWSTKARINTW